MTEKRFKSRCYEKQKNTVIYDKGVKLFDVSYRDFEDAYYLKMKLIPVVNKLNELSKENKELKEENQELLSLIQEDVDSWSDEKKQLLSDMSNAILGDFE